MILLKLFINIDKFESFVHDITGYDMRLILWLAPTDWGTIKDPICLYWYHIWCEINSWKVYTFNLLAKASRNFSDGGYKSHSMSFWPAITYACKKEENSLTKKETNLVGCSFLLQKSY